MTSVYGSHFYGGDNYSASDIHDFENTSNVSLDHFNSPSLLNGFNSVGLICLDVFSDMSLSGTILFESQNNVCYGHINIFQVTATVQFNNIDCDVVIEYAPAISLDFSLQSLCEIVADSVSLNEFGPVWDFTTNNSDEWTQTPPVFDIWVDSPKTNIGWQ